MQLFKIIEIDPLIPFDPVSFNATEYPASSNICLIKIHAEPLPDDPVTAIVILGCLILSKIFLSI